MSIELPLGAHHIDHGDAAESEDSSTDIDAMSRRFAAATVDMLIDLGCAGLMASMWSNPGPRAATVPHPPSFSRKR